MKRGWLDIKKGESKGYHACWGKREREKRDGERKRAPEEDGPGMGP